MDASESQSRHGSPSIGKALIFIALALAGLILSFGECRRQWEEVRDQHLPPFAVRVSQSPFSVSDDLQRHYQECTYRYLVLCERHHFHGYLNSSPATQGASRPATVETATSPSYFAIPVRAAVTLLEFPAAAFNLLTDRWGHPLEFLAAVFFLLIYLALIVMTVTREWPAGLWLGSGAVLFGPWIAGVICWTLGYVIAAAGAAAVWIVYLVVCLGVPTLTYVVFFYHAHEFTEQLGRFREQVKSTPKPDLSPRL